MMKHPVIWFVAAACMLAPVTASAAKDKAYSLSSPSGHLQVTVTAGASVTWSVARDGAVLLEPSPLSLTRTDGVVFGEDAAPRKAVRRSVDETVTPVVYKKAEVRDRYNELTLVCKGYDIVFRAYDAGVAYRFAATGKAAFDVAAEQVCFRFPADHPAYIPYVRSFDSQHPEAQFFNSFENTYTHTALSAWETGRLAFLPITVEAADGVKLCITESDLLDYPGLYLRGKGGPELEGVFAPYPKDIEQGGHNRLQGLVRSREPYIAHAAADEAFPWRILIVAPEDKDLLACDLPWLLGRAPAPGTDFSWVRPGKVAWDWWNDWNITGVDFEAGINNDTYKYYIDFAAKNGIEYVILDEGWAVNKQADLFQVIPEIDLPMLAAYAQERGVGLILWAGYWAVNRDIERVCREYAAMGIKGFKVDFMDRDDQPMVQFYRQVAETAARYHLLVDFHGAFKPAGLQRTWPNVLNFEGINGLEQLKWSGPDLDQVTYDVIVPFARFVAGPADYTQGAMRNAIRRNYRPVNSEAMSQGTRCRQLAEYVVFESPLNMLCDAPTNYLREPECLSFIAACPTTWDETVPLEGRIGEYVAVARRKGTTWYIGAMTDWSQRDMTLDLSVLGLSGRSMQIFRDGANAHRAGRDFRQEEQTVPADGKVRLHMAPGGGWAAVIR